jgi:asparagine synthase (glutamine-hydrolysing)
MSAIAGIVDFSGRPVDRRIIAAMTGAMAHRGPDGEGCWNGDAAALGARILRSTPDSLIETQPLRDERKRFCLVFDGRLDNRDELIPLLEHGDFSLADATDAELAIRAYDVWGASCPARFLGDFAFALWDQRKQMLFAARDQTGMRPFYYARMSSGLLFASEIQALFKCPYLARRPNRAAMARLILSVSTPASETLLEDVYRLAPGSALIMTAEGLTISQYWQVDTNSEIRYRSDDEYAEHFRDLFERATRCRLRGAGPTAALLSGGIDSASLVASASEIVRAESPLEKIELFSISFSGYPACDESEYVNALAATLGLEITSCPYDPAAACFDFQGKGQFPDVLYNLSHLIYAPALDVMRQRGTRILLAGFGSDELLASGLEHLKEMFLRADLAGLLGALRHDSTVYALPQSYLFAKYCLEPLVPRRIRNLIANFPGRRRIRQPNLEATRDLAGIAPEMNALSSPAPSFHQPGQGAIYRALFRGPSATAGSEVLNLFFPRFGIELRCPFLDRRLVEFAFAIPQDQRWRGRESKFVLRQSMKGRVPELIRARTAKADIAGPISAALQSRLSSAQAMLNDSALVALGVISREDFERELGRFTAPGTDNPYDLQMLIALESWLRADVRF